MKVMFSAGEASGDTHAASVANALKEIDPSVDMFGMGGTLMERAGVRIVYDIKKFRCYRDCRDCQILTKIL